MVVGSTVTVTTGPPELVELGTADVVEVEDVVRRELVVGVIVLRWLDVLVTAGRELEEGATVLVVVLTVLVIAVRLDVLVEVEAGRV